MRSLTSSMRVLILLLLISGFLTLPAQADPIGQYNATQHSAVAIEFQFVDPPATANTVSLGMSAGFPIDGASGFEGCRFQLFDQGSLVSDSTISSIFGCQGTWHTGAGSGSLIIDTNVDMTGILAGEPGLLLITPLLLPRGNNELKVNLDMPGFSLFMDNVFLNSSATILSQTFVPHPPPGDGNGDGWVDALDYLLWAGAYGTHPGPDGDISDGDYNDDGWIDGLDYLLWAGNFGTHSPSTAVPEPGSALILAIGVGALVTMARHCRSA